MKEFLQKPIGQLWSERYEAFISIYKRLVAANEQWNALALRLNPDEIEGFLERDRELTKEAEAVHTALDDVEQSIYALEEYKALLGKPPFLRLRVYARNQKEQKHA